LERVALSVDVVCFRIVAGALNLILVRRSDDPFAGMWALPGGIVVEHEGLDAAAERVLRERTGVTSAYLEQLYTFGDPDRDPRGRTVSVAYYALLPSGEHTLSAGRGVSDAAWFPVRDAPDLAFDHARIAAYAHQRLARKIDYAPLAFRVLPESFTMTDVRLIHESILGRPLHPSNFVKATRARWELEALPNERDRRARRPAQLYRYVGPREAPGQGFLV
jgi:8-oxo-dGTP diphosphatase